MGLIPTYTKKRLVSWSNDKELSLEVDVIGWNALKKKKIIKSFLLQSIWKEREKEKEKEKGYSIFSFVWKRNWKNNRKIR